MMRQVVGNQYVWIPISHYNGVRVNTITDNEGNGHVIELARYHFNSDGTVAVKTESITTMTITYPIGSYYYYEQTSQGVNKNKKAIDINGFLESAKSNGGYYISRYEAGDPDTELDRSLSSSTTTKPVFKANQTAYNYISQSDASKVTGELYSEQTYTSDLVNSFAWDTALMYIQEFSGDTDYSMQPSLQDTLVKTGQATDGINKDLRCNIYDMAGNLKECTTETHSAQTSSYYVVARGGAYKATHTPNYRTNLRDGKGDEMGFRRNFILVIINM